MAPVVRPVRGYLAMAGAIVGLHVAGWGVLLAVAGSREQAIGTGQVLGVGLGITAYTLGMRHAFDADHIAAIDNTTRKLVADGQRPRSVGFWFSLGHSTIVLVLVALLAAGVRALAGQLEDESSTLQRLAGLFGTVVSGGFLVLIGLVNLVGLVGTARQFARSRRSGAAGVPPGGPELRGPLATVLAPVSRMVTRPWHVYPVGLLFGLGFDTATEVGMLAIAAGAAAVDVPWYAILALPILFAAGMSLLDTVDGVVMLHAYGWANEQPVRRILYNLTVTAVSVGVALLIGGAELVAVAVHRLEITTGPLAAVARLDLGSVGYLMALLLVAVWLAALAYWKLFRLEDASRPGSPT